MSKHLTNPLMLALVLMIVSASSMTHAAEIRYLLGVGFETDGDAVRVAAVVEGSLADAMKIQVDDRLVRINNIKVFWDKGHFSWVLESEASKKDGFVLLVVQRGDREYVTVPQLAKRQTTEGGETVFAPVTLPPIQRYAWQLGLVMQAFEYDNNNINHPPQPKTPAELAARLADPTRFAAEGFSSIYTDDLPEDLRRSHSKLVATLESGANRIEFAPPTEQGIMSALQKFQVELMDVLAEHQQVVLPYTDELDRQRRLQRQAEESDATP